ncbi:MAG: right-handed parallel beta-helix repeat-containing protein [Planctomycetes bacterium]|nr:right-handed parallel beta-helix repeat-containing protein [Planctomycetota bacterium]
MSFPKKVLADASLNTKPAERLGYLGMALFVGSLLLAPIENAEAATITVTNNNDDGPGSLRQAVMSANEMRGRDTIVFSSTVTGTIALSSGEIGLFDPVIIQGPGRDVLTIDSTLYYSRIFYINTDIKMPVKISGLTLTGGGKYGLDGGAIHAFYSNVHVSDCTVTGSGAYVEGGGIFSKKSTLHIDNCTFSNNAAFGGGGGAIAAHDGDVIVTNSELTGNYAFVDGGGIYFEGYQYGYHYQIEGSAFHLTITNSTITGNRTKYYDGGGIYALSGLLTITGSTFTDNYAGDDGGAIGTHEIEQLDITNCTFLRNHSNGTTPLGGGGALNILHLQGPATITDCFMAYNSAQDKGGALSFETNRTDEPILISDTNLSNNDSSNIGGGIFSRGGNLVISESTVTDNNAIYDGGGIYFDGYRIITYGYYYTCTSEAAHLTIANSTISGNISNSRDGGGIYCNDGILMLTRCTFDRNYAWDDGGAVGANDLHHLDITNCEFLYNRSYGINFRGGGGALNILHLRGPGDIADSTISHNTASHKGGGIAFEHVRTSEPIVISNSNIDDNSSFYRGGGIWIGEGNLNISESSASGNYAMRFGGGVFFDSDNEFYALTVTGSTLYRNSTGNNDGGAVFSEGGLLSFTTCRFQYNHANDDGGAIGALFAPLLDISDCTFDGNESNGGDFLGGGGALGMKQFRGGGTIQDSTFVRNFAQRKGGALCFEFDGGNLAITRSTISGNDTFVNGGGIYQSYYGPGGSSGLTITNSTISGNYARNSGGAIALGVTTAPTQIADCLINDNFAITAGGGIYFYRLSDYSPLTITNSVIHSNACVGNGGGIGGRRLGNFSDLTLTNCTVSSNGTFQYDGGGLAISSDYIFAPVVVDRCRFLENFSDERGGGIFFDFRNDGLLQIRNTTIDGNEAYEGGGIYFYCNNSGLADQALEISTSTISNNSSFRNGGGIAFASDDPGFRLTNTTVSGNSSYFPGGGMAVYFYDQNAGCYIHNCTFHNNYSAGPGGGLFFTAYDGGGMEMMSSIIAGNSTDSFARDVYFPDTYLFTVYNLIGNGVAHVDSHNYGPSLNSNIFYTSPYLYELANNGGPTKTHKLTVSSPAIDAGVNAADSIFDQRGSSFPRNVGGLVDIGAFELNPDEVLPNEEQFFGFGPDSDGDGFSDDAEEAAGTDPDDPTETPLGKFLTSEDQFDALSILKAQVTLNFAKPLSDTIKLTGRIQLADGTDLNGTEVLLDIAGNSIAFTLDAKATGVAATGKIKFKAPKGGVSTFGLVMKGNFQTAFAANADMQNETTAKVGEGKIVRVAMALDGIGVFHADAVLSYKATQGKAGKAK